MGTWKLFTDVFRHRLPQKAEKYNNLQRSKELKNEGSRFAEAGLHEEALSKYGGKCC